jgi:hypothetical protein
MNMMLFSSSRIGGINMPPEAPTKHIKEKYFIIENMRR